MKIEDLAFQRDKYKHLSDGEWRWMLQQVEGRERTADKLPTFAAMDDWWYPVRLSCEQCSSEETARYKAYLVKSLEFRGGRHFADITGGYGVDAYFLSAAFEHTDYVEQNEELCRIAKHNKGLWVRGDELRDISVHNSTAEKFLQTAGQYDLIYLDPARRDSYGGKVFRLEDCTPNVVELLPTLLAHLTPEGRILLKLSPMLDLTQALLRLTPDTGHLAWDVYVVAIKNEVKEVLLLSGGTGLITAVDLAKKEQAFVFTREEESNSEAIPMRSTINNEALYYLYEPNAAILKAGAYKSVGQRFGLQKLDVNTHLYCSDKLVPDFPGRVWRVKDEGTKGEKANVLVRNYPLTPEQLKKKLHLRDGGTDYVIGCRVAGKPTLFFAERTEDIHPES